METATESSGSKETPKVETAKALTDIIEAMESSGLKETRKVEMVKALTVLLEAIESPGLETRKVEMVKALMVLLEARESSGSKETPKVETAKALTDFFEAMENKKTTIFSPQSGRCVPFTTIDCFSGSHQFRRQLAIRPIPTDYSQPFPSCGDFRLLDKPLPTIPSPASTNWLSATSVHCCSRNRSAVVRPIPDIPHYTPITDD